MSHLLSTVASASADAAKVLFLPLVSNLVHLAFIITCSFIYKHNFDQIMAEFTIPIPNDKERMQIYVGN